MARDGVKSMTAECCPHGPKIGPTSAVLLSPPGVGLENDMGRLAGFTQRLERPAVKIPLKGGTVPHVKNKPPLSLPFDDIPALQVILLGEGIVDGNGEPAVVHNLEAEHNAGTSS